MRFFTRTCIRLWLFAVMLAPQVRADDAPMPPPKELKPLVEAAGVRFEFHADKLPAYNCNSDIYVYWKGNTKLRTRKVGGDTEATVAVQIKEVKVEYRHTLHLPAALRESKDFWNEKTVRYALDYVAISADPRVPMLIEHLVRKIVLVKKTVPGTGELSQQQINDIVFEDINRKREAVSELIRPHYETLEKATQRGAVPLKDRPAFFHSLFTADDLKQREDFAFKDVADLVKQRKYLDAKRWLLTNDESLCRRRQIPAFPMRNSSFGCPSSWGLSSFVIYLASITTNVSAPSSASPDLTVIGTT